MCAPYVPFGPRGVCRWRRPIRRSGDPLHERCDESDVYEGEVAQVDMVPELVGRFDR